MWQFQKKTFPSHAYSFRHRLLKYPKVRKLSSWRHAAPLCRSGAALVVASHPGGPGCNVRLRPRPERSKLYAPIEGKALI